MRADLDRLMRERGLAGLVVFAHDGYSPPMYYVTGQRIASGIYFRSASGAAHLVHDPMERDQAAAVGCAHTGFPEHGWNARLEQAGHPARAYGGLVAEVCGTLGMRGPVGFYGDLPAGYAHVLVEHALASNRDLTADATHPDVLSLARMTKDAEELSAMRRASRGVVAALERLRAFLGSLERRGDHVHANGSGPVKLGDLRRLLLQEMLAHGASEDGESIVSQGRDAGVPHNRGNDAEPVRVGAPILIDLFPSETGGGYHSDVTRTYCLGPAPDDLKRLYADVRDAFDVGIGRLALGASCRDTQESVCELFEQRGHATARMRPGIEEGYVHGLGHGVGLAVHEPPRLGGPASNRQAFEPGMAITVEPGLYYPSRGLGVRIEDLVVAHPDGRFENLTPAPYDLEIELAG